MNAGEINRICKFRSFMGTFPCDKLPLPDRKPASYIINTDIHTQPGTHWVALHINENNTGEFFDSFGKKPNPIIHSFMKRVCQKSIYNTRDLQHIMSVSCGVYAIAFLRARNNAVPMNDFLDSFTESKLLNELKLATLF